MVHCHLSRFCVVGGLFDGLYNTHQPHKKKIQEEKLIREGPQQDIYIY